MTTYNVKSEVWLYPSATRSTSSGQAGAWHFVSLSKKQSEEITKKFGALRRGWNSFRVAATLGKTTWNTSIFYDKREGAYILPLKAEVRKKEGVRQGDKVNLEVRIMN